MADMRSLAVRLSVEDYAVVQRALNQLGDTGERALTRISASADRAAPAMRRSSEAIRQVGFQVQDIAVQLQGGQDPFLVLSQQGGQLAQALLGPKTALAATGVLIAAAVGKSLLFKDSTEKVTEAEKKLAEALEATNKVLLSREQQEFIQRQKDVADASKLVSKALEEEGQKLVDLKAKHSALVQQIEELQRRQDRGATPGRQRQLDQLRTRLFETGIADQEAKVQELGRRAVDTLTPSKQFPDVMKEFGPDPKKVRETIEALEAERKGIQALAAVAGQSAEATERVTAANKASEEIRKQKLDAGSRDAQQIRSLIEGTAALERQTKRTNAAREAELKTVQQKIAAEEAEVVAMYKATDAAIAAGGKMSAAMREEIDLLKGQAEEVRKSTIEFDALTGTYRLATRALDEYNKEQELLKRGMDPAEAKKQAQAWAEIREQIRQTEDQQKALVEQLNKQNELMLEPFKNAIQGIQGAFSQMFEDIFSGTTDLFGSLKKVAIRFAAEIATLLVFRPAVGGLLDSFGLGGLAQQMGLGSGGFGAGLAGSAAVSPSFIGPLLPGQSYATGAGGLGGISSLLGLGGGGAGFLGGGLQTLLLGGGIGFAAPQILRQLGVGIGKGSTGGSLLGAGGGALLGNFLLPGVGGILGGLAGGFLGDIVGGLFGGGGMSQQEYYDNVNYYNNEFQKTQARAAFNPTIGAYHAKSYAGGESAYKQALKQAEQEYQALTAKMTELGYDAANFAGVAEAYGRIVAKIGQEFREGMEREMDLALGQATGNMTAAFDDLVRTQGERRDEIKEVGADLVKAEQVFAAERLSFLQQLTQAQRDLIRSTLSSADLALAELADKGATVGDRLIAAGQAMDALGKNLQDFLKGLSLSDLSPLSAGAKYAQARETFEKTIAAARGGDADAIARVQSDLQVFLTASRGMFASGDQYSQDYAMATGLAAALAGDAPSLASGLGKAGIGLNAALLKGAGVTADGKVTDAEATPLLAELAALREQLVGLTGPASDAVKQVEDLSQQIEAMRSATAQLPSYGPGAVTPLATSLLAAANSNIPGWQQGAVAGGPSAEFKNALVAQLYPGLTYDQAPQAARSAVDSLFSGDAYSYLMMGGAAAAGTLMNTGLFSASELYQKYGIQGFAGFTYGDMTATGAAPGVNLYERWGGAPSTATYNWGGGDNWSGSGAEGAASGTNGGIAGGVNGSTGLAAIADLMDALHGEVASGVVGAIGSNPAGAIAAGLNALGSIAALGVQAGQPGVAQAISAVMDAVMGLAPSFSVDMTGTVTNNQTEMGKALSAAISSIGVTGVASAVMSNMADMIGAMSTNMNMQDMGEFYSGPAPSVQAMQEMRSNMAVVSMAMNSLAQSLNDPTSSMAKSLDLKALVEALLGTGSPIGRSPPGMAAAGGNPGTGAGQNDSGHGVGGSQGSENGQGGYAVGGWVTGGIPGRDSVRAWLMPREYVMPVGPAALYAPELEAMRAGTYRAGGDEALLAEMRALRQEVAMLRAERCEADNDAGQQRQAIVRAAGGRAPARRGPPA